MNQAPPVVAALPSMQVLIDLDDCQDALLQQLDDLNDRIEQAIVLGQTGIRSTAATAPINQPPL